MAEEAAMAEAVAMAAIDGRSAANIGLLLYRCHDDF
jgi:hypothetical protein